MSNWIKLTEKLPKSDDMVLITIKAGAHTSTGQTTADETIPAYFVDDSQGTLIDGLWYPHFYEWGTTYIFKNCDVVAWMPLPEPYSTPDSE